MTENASTALADRIEAIAADVCAELGLVVYDIEVAKQSGKVSIVVEREGGSSPGNGVTVGEITSVSRQVGYVLDAEDVVPFAHRFEVSSPGVERELRTPRQVSQNIGQEVRLVLTRETEDGRRVVEGRLETFEQGVLEVADGDHRWEIDLEDVKRGRTVFDFGSSKSERKQRKSS